MARQSAHERAEDMPRYVHAQLAPREKHIPERTLWLEVIRLAQTDTDHPPHTSTWRERDTARKQARAWLLDGGSNFRFVCMMADIDPDRLRRRARAVLQ